MRTLICLNIIALLLVSCKTYIIPTNSLIQQFQGIDSSRLRQVVVRGPLGEKYQYLANPISSIICLDQKGRTAQLANSPSIEVRVTHNNQKTVLYFDRLFLSGSVLKGTGSRFIPAATKEILLETISKIEIQNGRKNFHYETRPQ